MDNLSDNFGRLSTTAREWKPQGAEPQPQQNQQSNSKDWHQESELNATAVKEFVPGTGWSTSSSAGRNVSDSTATTDASYGYGDAEEQPQEQRPLEETTIPSGPTPPPFRSLQTMGLPDDLWRYHRELAHEAMRQMDPTDPRHKAVPIPYGNAYCLDAPNQQSRSSFGYPSSTFQVTSREDGYLYCLHRFEDVKSVSPKIAHVVSTKWAALEHAGILRLHNCFVAQRAVFFVHSFLKGARSLRDRWAGPLSEQVLWSVICQLVSVIRLVHANKLAVRTLDLAHVLAVMDASQMRLRVVVNCVGVVDALECESRKNMSDLQQEDIRALGRLLLSVATGTEITSATDNETLARCEQFCVPNFSRELHSLVFTLIKSRVPPTILDVSRAMAGRALDELDAVHVSLDRTEAALAAEYESGRSMRLLLKLGFINERPEFGVNRRWAQSGDCYVLTLFRDYVFHQADGGGNPVMDLGHVVTALNKLDAADEEKIVLSSRDGKSMMVVSYADIARCLDSAYHELCASSSNGSGSVTASTY